ncbi:bifunctional DNA-formamidopyrimidine glycosylase/DNA-(apurinic or apyrimidinic site) lyase [Haloferula sp. A504]|uniref:bifunctional DNA-formamidopyrimidine glycosylase/DNA-(apurinic or apyrimidinic site) lyase n=1 Tax=Haloferula sp. A504 TaxID=3373601 RepID=UPI0031CC00D3|nr:bifunctional DNA-formamidopyrimidine glycosylase/DNA-(apurinic or apyrimidinic site) lyase [Verrucomicrobiaceae bacterium E54]
MPELPEVETTRRGIEPHLVGRPLTRILIRESRLRHPVPDSLEALGGIRVKGVRRRGKYLLLDLDRQGSLIVHLGMSGSLRIAGTGEEFRKHDHLVFGLPDGLELRYHDPRRFGLVLHVPEGNPLDHPLLSSLGPEPLGDGFDAAVLHAACRKRSAPIKQVIMDASVVVGVGNIYASESLFHAGIRPRIAARRVSGPRLEKLVTAIRQVLTASIEQGGTTLRDFVNSDGEPGYFRQKLFVYERAGEPCRNCGGSIRHAVLGQRSTYWCPACQR